MTPTLADLLLPPTLHLVVTSVLVFVAVMWTVRYGYAPALRFFQKQEDQFDRVLRQQLLVDIEPRVMLIGSVTAVVVLAVLTWIITANLFGGVVVGAIAIFLPSLYVKHLATKRRQKLESQLVDGLTTLASGTRAGLNLVQSMELLVANHRGPIRQEFAQLLREYQMGMDLNQAMRSASERIGSPLYRLTFTAIETHRTRGGDTSESLDRIAESIREIHRLEGKLDALTSQGRMQAWAMAIMPFVFIVILYLIYPKGVTLLFTEPLGRIILLGVVILIAAAFLWIRKIMSIDI